MPAKNTAGEIKSDIIVLKEYFGLQPGQSIAGFNEEVKKLTPADKAELVEGACKNMGWEYKAQA